MMNPTFTDWKKSLPWLWLAATLLWLLWPELSWAGDQSEAVQGSSEFEKVWIQIKYWIQGRLGHIIAGFMVLVGIVGGVRNGSLMAFAVGIGCGLGLHYAPDIITGLMGATLDRVDLQRMMDMTLNNGLGGGS